MPNNTGDHAEAAFIHHAHRHLDSVEIFTPMTHRTKVDVAVRKPGFPLVGVQVKKATQQRKKCGAFSESWKFLVGSGQSWNNHKANEGKPRLTRYIDGDFDIIACYIMEHNAWAFYRLDELAGKATHRWSPTKGPNNNWEIFNEYF